MITRAGLYFRTVRHMPLHQLAYFFRRRMLNLPLAQLGANVTSRVDAVYNYNFIESLPPSQNIVRDNKFVFLNMVSEFSVYEIDWRAIQYPKLWRYNLHYFDWLKIPGIDCNWCDFTIQNWIECNPVGSDDAWEPYTVSLRLVNWLKYFNSGRRPGKSVPQEWIESVHKQALWLGRNMEFHIRANHLFKNIVAMLWFYSFCDHGTHGGAKGVAKSHFIKLFLRELDEQFNADGGHFERSPMYHSICLEDCIDVYNLLSAQDSNIDVLSNLAIIIEKGIEYQKLLSFRDGKIGLFGDSTLNGAHGWQILKHYWAKVSGLAIDAEDDDCHHEGCTYLNATGYVVYENSQYKIMISTASASPAYQPGHSHCDVGSFELFACDQRIIVDSGVSEYAPGWKRNHVRTSGAHNVVNVNQGNQHEIWGEFRIGSRMRVVAVEVSPIDQGTRVYVDMRSHLSHKPGYRHVRTFELREASVFINDHVELEKPCAVGIGFNIKPGLAVVSVSQGFDIFSGSSRLVSIEQDSNSRSDIVASWYCPEFGEMHAAKRLEFSQMGSKSVEIRSRIHIHASSIGQAT